MAQKNRDSKDTGSILLPNSYCSDYFNNPKRHSEDASFKANNFVKLLLRFLESNILPINSFIDVGCGSGDIVKIIADSLRESGFNSMTFKAYDVSPHVIDIKNDDIEYIKGDFCESDEFADIVTLFDVIEHIPDTIKFIENISQRCKVIGFHIPLDNSINVSIRNKFLQKLQNPGHVVFMDSVFALNLLALSGLRVVDYEYSFCFTAPSGHNSIFSKIIFPLRYLLAKISPWLLSKTLGGVSLFVLAITPKGLQEI